MADLLARRYLGIRVLIHQFLLVKVQSAADFDLGVAPPLVGHRLVLLLRKVVVFLRFREPGVSVGFPGVRRRDIAAPEFVNSLDLLLIQHRIGIMLPRVIRLRTLEQTLIGLVVVGLPGGHRRLLPFLLVTLVTLIMLIMLVMLVTRVALGTAFLGVYAALPLGGLLAGLLAAGLIAGLYAGLTDFLYIFLIIELILKPATLRLILRQLRVYRLLQRLRIGQKPLWVLNNSGVEVLLVLLRGADFVEEVEVLLIRGDIPALLFVFLRVRRVELVLHGRQRLNRLQLEVVVAVAIAIAVSMAVAVGCLVLVELQQLFTIVA